MHNKLLSHRSCYAFFLHFVSENSQLEKFNLLTWDLWKYPLPPLHVKQIYTQGAKPNPALLSQTSVYISKTELLRHNLDDCLNTICQLPLQ